ncbi:type II secretion system minor pseudopilin GspK [Polynucleobacter sp. IMCC30063]|uniref:type II secretion system minor pseudopilin GspK n=1 Tax=unclassified Polynucleobacter TaxID=2640945 RepID=UPI001F1DA085|nr:MULTISPECIES: type II secretion system minor pseudopilin GspK [unclassified Polynucleobacter]MCE7505452.1 type II secretion system minor pseudopilin GspK [Polynucleobacter sp. IMCC30063]MCE7528035.1 type II secretion system minor pseudopilin GspK [Polynucleobacter sp. IMCC 30228]MCE7530386.1 type II secretion system minor pseudopilin GspK [Polynucleobacter sp. IMCC 29146]NBX99588.1 general secretion pathway protein GspK [Burkholderiaceae bacterium]
MKNVKPTNDVLARSGVSAQTGSATITALIVVGVSVVLMASLMWRQQLQVRTLENLRDRTQVLWLQHGILDFARLVLAQDGRTSQYDHLGESWALPLADSKVADFLKNADIPDELQSVTVQGRLTDAQGLFNLTNLWNNQFQGINAGGVSAYGRLLAALGLDANLAQQTAQAVLQTQIPLVDLDGLASIPGYTPALIEKLRPHVAVLPINTAINVNTASAEVLMAAFAGLSRSAANNLVQYRTAAPMKALDEITTLLTKAGAGAGVAVDGSLVNVKSQFWLAQSEIHLGSGIFVNSALIQRSPVPLPSGIFTQVIWNKSVRMLPE